MTRAKTSGNIHKKATELKSNQRKKSRVETDAHVEADSAGNSGTSNVYRIMVNSFPKDDFC